jgi:hypothetical protein
LFATEAANSSANATMVNTIHHLHQMLDLSGGNNFSGGSGERRLVVQKCAARTIVAKVARREVPRKTSNAAVWGENSPKWNFAL